MDNKTFWRYIAAAILPILVWVIADFLLGLINYYTIGYALFWGPAFRMNMSRLLAATFSPIIALDVARQLLPRQNKGKIIAGISIIVVSAAAFVYVLLTDNESSLVWTALNAIAPIIVSTYVILTASKAVSEV